MRLPVFTLQHTIHTAHMAHTEHSLLQFPGVGRGPADQGPEPWRELHDDREAEYDLGNPEEHHLQPSLSGAGQGRAGQGRAGQGRECRAGVALVK